MGFVDDIEALVSAPPGKTCTVGWALSQMDAADASAFAAALADRQKQATGLSRVLTAHGWQVRPQAIRRHRSGECSCEPR